MNSNTRKPISSHDALTQPPRKSGPPAAEQGHEPDRARAAQGGGDSPGERDLRAEVGERTLLSTEDYVAYYLSEGQRLLRQGVEPVLPAAVYVSAFPQLRAFLRQNGETLAERGVVSAEIEAGQVLVSWLEGVDKAQREGERRTARNEAVTAASSKLAQVRDSVRRLTRGAEGAEVRRHFGLDHKVDAASVTSLLHGLDLFLDGAQRLSGRLRSYRLIPADILQLAEHRRVLEDHREAIAPAMERMPAAARGLLLAVDNYFASLAAAITTAFADGDPRRIAGLKLIPRYEDRRDRAPTRPLPKLWRPAMPTTDE